MLKPGIPEDEIDRLKELHAFGILDTPAEPLFDEVAELAATICGTAYAIISLVDEKRLWLKAEHGMAWGQITREMSVCAHAILGGSEFEVPDIWQDARFASNPVLNGALQIRFYSGTPLLTPDGFKLGMLAVMDTQPRVLSEAQRRALSQFSRVAVELLSSRKRNRELAESQALLARHEVQQAAGLAATNAFLDSMIEHIPTAVYIKDTEHLRYVRINRAAEQMLGMTREELLGKSATDLFGQPEAASLEAQDREVIARQDVVDVPEQNIPWRGQATRIVHTRKAPVLNARGEMTHILGIAEDVTHQKLLQQQVLDLNTVLRARAEDLEFTNKSLEGFAAATTHDLRSPLNVIGGYAGLLEKMYGGQLDEKGRHYLSVIRARTSSMAALIDDLLAFSRLGSKEICKIRVDTQQMVAEVVAELLQGGTAPLPDIQLGPLPAAHADPALLRQVWINLLSNAVKYSGKTSHPRIEVSGFEEDGEVVYTVRDNGAGFNMDNYVKLFEVFERLHTDEEFEGTGVGLPIVHRIVTRHGGRVWAESKVGQGAVFRFSLPVLASAPAPAPAFA